MVLPPKLISCRVMIEELRPFLPEGIETEVFDISLHTNPRKLRERLQEAIDASDGLFDPIYLGYGMCAKGTVGLVARKSRLVIPRTDDCIELFLGSRPARLAEIAREPGTYFLTQGYIGDGASMIFADFQRSAARYGKERAEKLLDKMMEHYRRLVYLRMPNVANLEADRTYARKVAERFHMDYVEIDGTTEWLGRLTEEKLPEENWRDDFVVVEPGQPIETSHFLSHPAKPKAAS